MPRCRRTADTQRIKDDMLANLEEKYQALLAEGKNPAEGDRHNHRVHRLGRELRKELGLDAAPPQPDAAASQPGSGTPAPAVAQEYGRYQTRKYAMIAAGVALFILAPFTASFFEDTLHLEAARHLPVFAMVAVGVALCILSGRKDDYYRELYGLGRDEDDDEGDNDDSEEKAHPVSTLFASIAFPLAAAVYVCIGVFYGFLASRLGDLSDLLCNQNRHCRVGGLPAPHLTGYPSGIGRTAPAAGRPQRAYDFVPLLLTILFSTVTSKRGISI